MPVSFQLLALSVMMPPQMNHMKEGTNRKIARTIAMMILHASHSPPFPMVKHDLHQDATGQHCRSMNKARTSGLVTHR